MVKLLFVYTDKCLIAITIVLLTCSRSAGVDFGKNYSAFLIEESPCLKVLSCRDFYVLNYADITSKAIAFIATTLAGLLAARCVRQEINHGIG